LKFDQDKPFGSTNLRSAFAQVPRAGNKTNTAATASMSVFDCPSVSAPPRLNIGCPISTTAGATFLKLVEKARSFNESKAKQMIADRDYQALDQMVIEHLLGK